MNLDFNFDEAAHSLLILSVRQKEWLFSLRRYYALRMCIGGLYCLENYKQSNDKNEIEQDVKNLLKYSRGYGDKLIDTILTSANYFTVTEEKYMGFIKRKRVWLTQEGVNKRVKLSNMVTEEIQHGFFNDSLVVAIGALSIYSCLYRRLLTRPGKKDIKEFMNKIKTFYPFLYTVCKRIRIILSSSY